MPQGPVLPARCVTTAPPARWLRWERGCAAALEEGVRLLGMFLQGGGSQYTWQ